MEEGMTFLGAYLWCAFGIVLSIVLPVLSTYLPETKVLGLTLNEATAGSGVAGFWAVVRPYLIIAVFALLAAILIIAGVKDEFGDWRAAVLAGYAWQSTLQQFKE